MLFELSDDLELSVFLVGELHFVDLRGLASSLMSFLDELGFVTAESQPEKRAGGRENGDCAGFAAIAFAWAEKRAAQVSGGPD